MVRRPVGLHSDAVHEAEIDDVDPELGVDHVAQRLQQVLDLRIAAPCRRTGRRPVLRLSGSGRLGAADCARCCLSSCLLPCLASPSAWAVASFQAIQPSSAHLIRAGYFDTPSNATASSEHVLVWLGLAPRLHQLQELVADLHGLADRSCR